MAVVIAVVMAVVIAVVTAVVIAVVILVVVRVVIAIVIAFVVTIVMLTRRHNRHCSGRHDSRETRHFNDSPHHHGRWHNSWLAGAGWLAEIVKPASTSRLVDAGLLMCRLVNVPAHRCPLADEPASTVRLAGWLVGWLVG